MKPLNQQGLTLIELLVGMAILAMIVTAAAAALSAALTTQNQGEATLALYQEGLLAMERMVQGVQLSTYLLIPNNHTPTRDILAFSGTVNDDNDFYFEDPLFPRIDEDPGQDMNGDGDAGIDQVDDDGDTVVDNSSFKDDDEDGTLDEDPLDGIDNDGDGLIDEDPGDDISDDGESGFANMDDNGDGDVDEGDSDDDDEDGTEDEDPLNPVLYTYDSNTNTLQETFPHSGQTAVISSRVTQFQTVWQAAGTVLITLILSGDDGESVTFSEYVYPRNRLQKSGRRVR
jgi:prepilin-type N-terminal cleavage/methylation domain-containing protein